MYKIQFRQEAVGEYEQAVDWYADINKVVAERFIDSVVDKLTKLRDNPFQYKSIYRNYREVSTSRFPYSIVYIVEDGAQRVIIVSIYHHRCQSGRKYR